LPAESLKIWKQLNDNQVQLQGMMKIIQNPDYAAKVKASVQEEHKTKVGGVIFRKGRVFPNHLLTFVMTELGG
jgi:hypothetical protein